MTESPSLQIIGGVALAWPLQAAAQRSGKLFRIGWFTAGPAGDVGLRRGFVEALSEFGWTEGKNVIFESRDAENRLDRLPELAAELVRLNVDVIVAAGTLAPLAAKDVIQQHTRHLKNLAFDIEHKILAETNLERFSLFAWQKQTSKMMFGSYPYPGNIIENNTIEFINVYVKPGKPPKFDPDVKEANELTRTEWLDLTQQVWFMYPEDIKREGDHPAPFPEKLPARLLRLYTYGAVARFPGEVVLDPFVCTGTTCAVAKSMGRRGPGETRPAGDQSGRPACRSGHERARSAAPVPPR